MAQPIAITKEDILQQLKLSFQLPEIVEQIIIRKIITATAADLNISIATEELQTIADQMRLINNLITAEDTWQWLERNYLSLDDFEDIVSNSVLSGKLATQLFSEQVASYFYEHQLDYLDVVMYEVMLDDEDLAWELFYAIKEGETSYFDVAHKYIQDIELRRRCGYLGLVNRRDLTAEISTAVFAAKPPQLLKPILTAKGIHLIFVEEIIQRQLDDKLYQEIATHLYDEWLNIQRQEYELNLQLE